MGTTINVAAGTYTENVTIRRNGDAAGDTHGVSPAAQTVTNKAQIREAKEHDNAASASDSSDGSAHAGSGSTGNDFENGLRAVGCGVRSIQ